MSEFTTPSTVGTEGGDWRDGCVQPVKDTRVQTAVRFHDEDYKSQICKQKSMSL